MTVSSSEKRNILIITALIFVAVVCRALALSGIISHASTTDVNSYYLSLLRTLIYAGLFMSWGISIQKRILQRQTRRLLLAVAVLMIFWLAVRTVKYLFVPTGVILSNWLWYSYYIPMLLIPLLLYFTAVSLGWPEEKRLPRKAYLLYLPAAVLILLVLSNDLHELVFDFPEDGLQMYLFNNYHYGPIFYICLAWEGVLYLAAFLITVSKCRRTQERSTLLLPLIPVFLLLGNVLLHLGHNPISHVLLGDLPVFVCLMIVLFLELCIHVGVIRSNTGYEELFARGTLGAQLLDRQGRLIYTSLNNWNIPEEVKQKALREGTAELDADTLIECHPIRGGYVLWKKDISELTAILEKLSDNEEELSGRLELEQKNYETRLAIEEYREENRLYDLLRESNAARVSAMKDLLDRFTKETDPVLRQKMLHKAAILTSYVKRRGNLLLIGEKKHRVELQELYLCFRESLSNLELSGANCAVQFEKEGFLRFSDALRLYDFYEEIAEQAGEGVNALLVKLWIRDQSLAPDHTTAPKTASLQENETAGSDRAGRRQGIFRIEAECASDLSRVLDLADEGGIEDGIWHFDIHVYIYNEEGARV